MIICGLITLIIRGATWLCVYNTIEVFAACFLLYDITTESSILFNIIVERIKSFMVFQRVQHCFRLLFLNQHYLLQLTEASSLLS